MASKELKDLSVNLAQGTTKTSVGNETVDQTVSRAKAMLEPIVSASEISTPPAKVNPPVPATTTNDGSRLNGLIGTTATNLGGFITSESENAQKRDELASLLGTQVASGADERAQLGEQYGLPANMQRLTDIQTQLAQRNTASQVTQAKIQGAAGQTLAQGQREVTQEQKEAAIRDAGLAAEANVLQGSIETASTIINQAMTDYYADRQLNNQNMIQQLEYYSGLADQETAQLLQKEQRAYEEDQTSIKRAQSIVDSGVASGYLAGTELQDVLAVTDPTAQAEKAQMIIARKIQAEIAEAKAAKASGGTKAPDVKNFGTTDNPIWKQWNPETGQYEDVSGLGIGADSPEATQQSLDQLGMLRDTASRILGGTDPLTGESYDALYEASGPSGIGKFLGDTFVGDTDYRRLETYADTLRTNVLALMTDPSIKKFFGPQMSNADVKLMSSTGSTLRPESNSPSDMKSEVERLDDLLNRMETAVKNGTKAPVQGTMQPVNVITAPDGTQIEIID